jgi:hypothetical protein
MVAARQIIQFFAASIARSFMRAQNQPPDSLKTLLDIPASLSAIGSSATAGALEQTDLS